MQESKESSKNSFIESLIKYKKHFGQTFPILALKNSSQEEIILKIEDAIKNNVMFRTNNSSSKISYKELIYKIKKSMSNVGYDYNIIINEYNDYVNLRKQSHIFSFKEHLRALILSQLYNDRWGDNNIRKYIDSIRIIFKDYDKDLSNTYYTVEKLGRNLKKQKTKQLETSEDEINELYEALKKTFEIKLKRVSEILASQKFDVDYPKDNNVMYCKIVVYNLINGNLENSIINLCDERFHIEVKYENNNTMINIHKIL